MRKVLLGALAAVIVLLANVGTAFAAGAGCGRYFVDANGDGVCDNAGSICTYADADGDGVCDNCGIYHWCDMTGNGGNHVDADGDGICDNYVTGQCVGNGRGRENGRGSQDGHSRHGRCGR